VKSGEGWESVLSSRGWRVDATSADGFFVAEFVATAAIRDVSLFQIQTWQLWQQQQQQPNLLVTGVFDAPTQLALERSPVHPLWPPLYCSNGTNLEKDNQGQLALVIAVPTGVLLLFVALLSAYTLLLKNGTGPRVPLANSRRGHADPQWISQRHPDDLHEFPDFNNQRLDEWEVCSKKRKRRKLFCF
jgi:hypothetical protein